MNACCTKGPQLKKHWFSHCKSLYVNPEALRRHRRAATTAYNQPESHRLVYLVHRYACRRDSKIYAATCVKLGSKRVAFKAYDATNICAAKQRSVKREARIMKYLTLKK